MCKRQRGEENSFAQKLLPRPSPQCGCTTPTQQMSSLYARATAARPKPSRPAADVLVVYIYYPQKILPPEAFDRPARCASVRRHGLTWPRGHVLPWRFLGDHHHHHGLSEWTGSGSDFTPFAISPASGWIIVEKGSQNACLRPGLQQNAVSHDWHLAEGFTVG